MKTAKKFISAVLCAMLCLSLLLFGAGCGDDKAALLDYAEPESFDKFSTTSVAENSRFSLIWNAEKKRVILYDKEKMCEWSYVPFESMDTNYGPDGYEKNNHPSLESPIHVKYYYNSTGVDKDIYAAAGSINSGKFVLNKIENGLEMVCYFTKYAFTVPIRFTLVEDGIEISVDPEKIEEGDEYSISSIVMAPMFCSVSNDNAGKDDHYMFIPSGSGTLLYPTYTNGVGIITNEPVYGEDENIEKEEKVTLTETIRMPVYGAVNGDRAVCAVIKDGSESAYINTMVGQGLTGYSYVTSEFYIKGYQEAVQSLFTNSVVKTNLYTDKFTADDICVGFYPLYDDEASYVGMANKYREHLTENGKLSTERSKDSILNLKLVGGIESKEFIFGIPKFKMLTATTINQAKEILADVKAKTGLNEFNANLVGFGSNGNDIGVIAGDYEINKAFGKEKDIKGLTKYCAENGVNLFMNFDMIRFSSSGGGVDTTFGRADAANGSFTAKHYYQMNFRVNGDKTYYLASRSKLAGVANNISETVKDLNFKGVSLDTLTSLVYSDYSDAQYYSAANTVEQFGTIINNFSNEGYLVAGSDANAFLAGLCDHVYDVPVRSSRYMTYTVDVPFYEIVFKGYVSMSTTSLNLATNANDIFLKSVETGTGLTYTLVSEYDTNLVSSYQNVFYGSVYWDEVIGKGVRDDIVKRVTEYKEFFDLVNGASIVDHSVVSEEVNMTTFDNGISVYVNYSDYDFATDDGTVAAGGYLIIR